jgi:hypothetical protein
MAAIRALRMETSDRHKPIGPSSSKGCPMHNRTKDYRESLLQDLQDPREAAAYLTAALEERDSAVFLLALRGMWLMPEV